MSHPRLIQRDDVIYSQCGLRKLRVGVTHVGSMVLFLEALSYLGRSLPLYCCDSYGCIQVLSCAENIGSHLLTRKVARQLALNLCYSRLVYRMPAHDVVYMKGYFGSQDKMPPC